MENHNPYQAPQSEWDDTQDDNIVLLDEPNRLTAGSGISWFGQAWQIFKARPLLWIGLMLAYFVFLFAMGLLSAIPFVGFLINVAIGIFAPMLMAGVYYIAYGIDNDNDVSFGDVTIAFSQGRIKDFFFLWLWQFLIMLGIIAIIVGMAFVLGVSVESAQDPTMPILLLLVALALLIPVMMMSVFSPALILFHNLSAWEAMKLSLNGCMRNILPFLLNGILLVLLCIVGALTFGLGFLIIVPLMMICMYVAYHQIFVLR